MHDRTYGQYGGECYVHGLTFSSMIPRLVCKIGKLGSSSASWCAGCGRMSTKHCEFSYNLYTLCSKCSYISIPTVVSIVLSNLVPPQCMYLTSTIAWWWHWNISSHGILINSHASPPLWLQTLLYKVHSNQIIPLPDVSYYYLLYFPLSMQLGRDILE